MGLRAIAVVLLLSLIFMPLRAGGRSRAARGIGLHALGPPQPAAAKTGQAGFLAPGSSGAPQLVGQGSLQNAVGANAAPASNGDASFVGLSTRISLSASGNAGDLPGRPRSPVGERVSPYPVRFFRTGVTIKPPEFGLPSVGQEAVANFATRLVSPSPFSPRHQHVLQAVRQHLGLEPTPQRKRVTFVDNLTGQKVVLKSNGVARVSDKSVVFHMEHPTKDYHFGLHIPLSITGAAGMNERKHEVAAIERSLDLLHRVHAARGAYQAGHVLVPLASLSLADRPNVVDSGEHIQLLNDFQLYPTYEGSLDDLLRILDAERGDDALRARISLTWQLVGSLVYLSTLGKGQPDISPSTLLIHESGVLLVRVREILQEMNPFPLDIVATPAYMPPEVLQSWLRARFPLDYSSKIDSWIAGCVIYRVWCGSLPYGVSELDTSRDRETVARVLEQITVSELEFDTCVGTPDMIAELLRGLLHKDQRRRPRMQTVPAIYGFLAESDMKTVREALRV